MTVYGGMGYSSNPLIFIDQTTGIKSSLLGSITDTNVGGTLRLSPNLQLGANLTFQTQNFSSRNIGFSPIMPYLELKYRFHKKFALIPNIQLPTSATKDFESSGIEDFEIGVPNGSYGINLVYEENFNGLTTVVSTGYSIAPDNVSLNIDESSAFRYGLHLYHPVTERFGVISEFFGRITPSNSPSEFLAGITYTVDNSTFKMVAGTGNFNGSGSNDFKTSILFTFDFDKPPEAMRKDSTPIPNEVKKNRRSKTNGIVLPIVPLKKENIKKKKEIEKPKYIDPRQKDLEDGMEYQKAPDVLYPGTTSAEVEIVDENKRILASEDINLESDPVPFVPEMNQSFLSKEKSSEPLENDNTSEFFSDEDMVEVNDIDGKENVIEESKILNDKNKEFNLDLSVDKILKPENQEEKKEIVEVIEEKNEYELEENILERGPLLDIKSSDVSTDKSREVIDDKDITIINLPKERGRSYLDNNDMPLPARPDPEEESKIILESGDIEYSEGPEFMRIY
jgi:hypothetical protein